MSREGSHRDVWLSANYEAELLTAQDGADDAADDSADGAAFDAFRRWPRHVFHERVGEFRDRQGLEPDFARTREGGEKDAVAAEDGVLDARDGGDLKRHAGLKSPNVAGMDELRQMLNKTSVPDFDAVARTGVGVFDTLKMAAKLVLTELKKGGG